MEELSPTEPPGPSAEKHSPEATSETQHDDENRTFTQWAEMSKTTLTPSKKFETIETSEAKFEKQETKNSSSNEDQNESTKPARLTESTTLATKSEASESCLREMREKTTSQQENLISEEPKHGEHEKKSNGLRQATPEGNEAPRETELGVSRKTEDDGDCKNSRQVVDSSSLLPKTDRTDRTSAAQSDSGNSERRPQNSPRGNRRQRAREFPTRLQSTDGLNDGETQEYNHKDQGKFRRNSHPSFEHMEKRSKQFDNTWQHRNRPTPKWFTDSDGHNKQPAEAVTSEELDSTNGNTKTVEDTLGSGSSLSSYPKDETRQASASIWSAEAGGTKKKSGRKTAPRPSHPQARKYSASDFRNPQTDTRTAPRFSTSQTEKDTAVKSSKLGSEEDKTSVSSCRQKEKDTASTYSKPQTEKENAPRSSFFYNKKDITPRSSNQPNKRQAALGYSKPHSDKIDLNGSSYIYKYGAPRSQNCKAEKDSIPRSTNHQDEKDTIPRTSNSKSQTENDRGPRSSSPKIRQDVSSGSQKNETKTDTTPRSSQPPTRNGTAPRHSDPQNENMIPKSSVSQSRKDIAPKPPVHTSRTKQRGAAHAEDSPKQSGPKETKLFIRVHQVFDDCHSFFSFIESKTAMEGNVTHSAEDKVISRDGITFYTVTCPSKTKAIKMQQDLTRDRQKTKPRIDCSFTEFPKSTSKQERMMDQRNLMVSDAMFYFDTRSDFHVRESARRSKMIEQFIDTEYKKLRNLDTHDEAQQNIKHLKQEQLELTERLDEFKATRDELKTQLQSTQAVKITRQIESVRKLFERECTRVDKALPIYGKRKEMLQLVEKNPVTVILGETGSGKSTQLVQYLYESGMFQSGSIVCTQPRRVAATSLASRVAEEMLTRVGQEVGYKLGSKSRHSPSTHILFTTDHCLLSECLTDPELKAYSCIIVDEAHERSLHTDLLLSMIKKCLPKRSDLRVIITSATIDPHVFQEFFGGCPVLEVKGRVFPVEVVWRKQEDGNVGDNYCEDAVNLVLQIHTYEPEGDILTFVTSPAQTEKCSQLLCEKLKGAKGAFRCFQLHGKQHAEDQQRIFQPLPRQMRKIVFATNCAETSLTIDGIKYVVDTGLAKEMRYDPKRNLNSLRLSLISQSSANQRKGRAGRTASGKCFRLYSEETYESMERVSLPEILRIHLGHALLKLAELGVEQNSYEFVQSPSQDSILKAMEMLESLGALDGGRITEKGRWIAKLPFDPRLGLLTYLGRQQNLLYDCVVLASVMSAEGGVFYRGTSKEDQRLHDATKTKFSLDKGDSLTSLSVYRVWLQIPDKQKNAWCMENGLNAKALRGIRETIGEVCHVLKDDLISQEYSEEDNTEQLRKMIVTCYATNLCHYLGQENAGYYAAHDSCRVHLHPSSCLKSLASVPEWVVYDQLIQTSRDFITGITPVDESWLQDIDERTLRFSIEDVRRKTIQKVYSRSVGSRAFFKIVGPCFVDLRKLEETFITPGSVIFIEALKDLGQISIYSTEEADDTEQLIHRLEEIIQQAVQEVEQEDREESVAGTKKQGVRVVMGLGGQVKEVLMPNQTRKVFVNRERPPPPP